jgi:hypothetical protein
MTTLWTNFLAPLLAGLGIFAGIFFVGLLFRWLNDLAREHTALDTVDRTVLIILAILVIPSYAGDWWFGREASRDIAAYRSAVETAGFFLWLFLKVIWRKVHGR